MKFHYMYSICILICFIGMSLWRIKSLQYLKPFQTLTNPHRSFTCWIEIDHLRTLALSTQEFWQRDCSLNAEWSRSKNKTNMYSHRGLRNYLQIGLLWARCIWIRLQQTCGIIQGRKRGECIKNKWCSFKIGFEILLENYHAFEK